jgi:murein DD-endopeptidase MepM/ murein hydrolase activator NlpD
MRQRQFQYVTFSILLIGLALLLSSCKTVVESDVSQNHLPSTASVTVTDPRFEKINTALQNAILSHDEVLAFLIYNVRIDSIDFSEDGQYALVWLTLTEKDTGENLPGEPGLAIAEVKENQEWQITLQADAEWNETLSRIPLTLLDDENRQHYLSDKPQDIPHDHKVYTGYRLPWPAGRSVRVSGSIGHVFTYKSCPSTCLYAFDFADGTMFPVVAARSGTVKYAVWRHPNGNTKYANFLVLEDTTTVPTTYQVYFHLAQDSIPEALRTPGAKVYQGQFIGNADDTGYSTGHHLHFHVHTNPNSYWGSSVDIVFDEVEINGGRPRTCTEATNFPNYGAQCVSGNWLLSENGDQEIPTGDIEEPVPDMVISTQTMAIAGWADDDYGIASIQPKVFFNNEWRPIGEPASSSPFLIDVDLCEAKIPNGPFLLAVDITDTAGKPAQDLTGVRMVIKDFECPTPPPTCNPAPDQIALYPEIDFQGECTLLDHGNYAELSTIEYEIQSVQLGIESMVLFYPDINFLGDPRIFADSDNDLGDEMISHFGIQSIQVMQRTAKPTLPILTMPQKENGQPYDSSEDITLTWEADSAAEFYSVQLTGPDQFQMEDPHRIEKEWHIGQLSPGEYIWSVTANNNLGASEQFLIFNIADYQAPASTSLIELPEISDSTAVQLSWKVEEGLSQIDHFEIQYQTPQSEWQNWETNLEKETRSIWFYGDFGQTYAFRIRSVDTRGNTETYQAVPETATTIIDNCERDKYESNGMPDSNWVGAAPLDLNQTQTHNLCGQGDVDWVVFSAVAGKAYEISSTPLDSQGVTAVTLIDTDHISELGSYRAEKMNQISKIDWTCPISGIYFLKIESMNPKLAGTDTQYNLRIDEVAEISPTNFLLGSILLPILWAIIKFAAKIRNKIYAD